LKVVLTGSMNEVGVLEVESQFNEIMKLKMTKIIFDLKDVSSMNSRGIRALVFSAKLLGEKGGKLVLVNPSAAVEETIKTAGVDAIVPIAPDLNGRASTAVGITPQHGAGDPNFRFQMAAILNFVRLQSGPAT
jgi:anti-anti-sigma factor